MDELRKWVEASLEIIKTGFAAGAPEEARSHAATACLSLHAMLSPATIVPMAPPPPPEPDIFDVLMSKLQPFASTGGAAFNPKMVDRK